MAAERKAARQRAIDLGVRQAGSGPDMGEAQVPLDQVRGPRRP